MRFGSSLGPCCGFYAVLVYVCEWLGWKWTVCQCSNPAPILTTARFGSLIVNLWDVRLVWEVWKFASDVQELRYNSRYYQLGRLARYVFSSPILFLFNLTWNGFLANWLVLHKGLFMFLKEQWSRYFKEGRVVMKEGVFLFLIKDTCWEQHVFNGVHLAVESQRV